MKCSICFKEIKKEPTGWEKGHNAQPINNGRCCQECNINVVIKARINQIDGGK